jgi:hypothetical protein
VAKVKVRKKKVPRPESVDDLYGAGDSGMLLKGMYDTPAVYAWFQKRHEKGRKLIEEDGYYRYGDHEWKVPYGVRMAFEEKLLWGHMAHKHPYFVTWTSPKTGKRLKKFFGSMPNAVHFIATKAQYVDEDAAVVVRNGFDMPVKLRGKFPRKLAGRTHYWCPRCMSPRVFRRNGQEFFAMRKEWNTEKARYEYRDRRLAVLCCTICGLTNRDPKFRRCNQPWEKRKFKRGVRKAKRRK